MDTSQHHSPTVQALSKISLAIRHHERREGSARGLSPLQAQILAVLATRGPLRLSGIAELIGVKLPALSEAATTLEAKGLIGKAPDPDDSRARRVSMTRAGKREAAAHSQWPDILAEALEVLTDDERASLHVSLIKMIATLERAGRIPLSRMCVTCVHFRPYAEPEADRPHYCALLEAPLHGRDLRVDCPDQESLAAEEASAVWARFLTPPPDQPIGTRRVRARRGAPKP